MLIGYLDPLRMQHKDGDPRLEPATAFCHLRNTRQKALGSCSSSMSNEGNNSIHLFPQKVGSENGGRKWGDMDACVWDTRDQFKLLSPGQLQLPSVL